MCPAGSANPSTDSLNRTTTLSGVISALFTDVNALITAEATSFRTSAVLHAFGNHATWTNGIYYCFFGVFFFFFFFFFFFEVLFLYPTGREREREREKRRIFEAKEKKKDENRLEKILKKRKTSRQKFPHGVTHPPFFFDGGKDKEDEDEEDEEGDKGAKRRRRRRRRATTTTT